MSGQAIGPSGLRLRADHHGGVVEAEARGEYLRLDAAGRWTAWRDGTTWRRRDVRGEVHEGRPPGAALPPAERDALHDAVARRAVAWIDDLEEATPDPEEALGVRAALLALLRRAARLDAPAMRREAELARRAYPDGIPILPPHRYRDLVVTLARGCPNAGCTFCAFYAGRPFRPLDDAAFEAHLRDLLAFAGPTLDAVDGLFLGEASAASLPDALLSRRLARLREVLGARPRGLAAFLDPDHVPRRPASRWAALREEGLVDLTVGLETGHGPLRRAVGKSADLDHFTRVVRAAREGGLRVSVTVLVGLGGEAAGPTHREATRRVVAEFGLGADDLVYLALLEDALPRSVLLRERAALLEALAGATPARAIPYPARGFVAWA